MRVIQYLLKDDEYYTEIRKKDTIYIHHTAGGHRPDWTIDGWERDTTKSGTSLRVGTAYVIGGLSTSSAESAYNGVIYQAFNEKYWCNHLGLKQFNNKVLNMSSIAIELCNYGPLTKSRNGEFLNYVNKPIPLNMVGILKSPFRGYTYYHKYTDQQLSSLRELLKYLSQKYTINLNLGLKEILRNANVLNAFEMNDNALKGSPGVWTHVNVRRDKYDCWPQPELITLLKNL